MSPSAAWIDRVSPVRHMWDGYLKNTAGCCLSGCTVWTQNKYGSIPRTVRPHRLYMQVLAAEKNKLSCHWHLSEIMKHKVNEHHCLIRLSHVDLRCCLRLENRKMFIFSSVLKHEPQTAVKITWILVLAAEVLLQPHGSCSCWMLRINITAQIARYGLWTQVLVWVSVWWYQTWQPHCVDKTSGSCTQSLHWQ